MSEGIIAGCCGSIMLILFSTFLLVFIPRFTDEQTEKWRLPLPSIEGNRYEWCSVVDEDTVRFGGDEFKRVSTCRLENKGAAFEEGADLLLCDVCNGATYCTYPSPSYCPNCGCKVVPE